MEKSIDALAKHVLKKHLSESSSDEIKHLINQYPFFSPAYFLLLKKLDLHSEEYKEFYQKAILFYHDPLAFDRFMNDEKYKQEELKPIHLKNELIIEPIIAIQETHEPLTSGPELISIEHEEIEPNADMVPLENEHSNFDFLSIGEEDKEPKKSSPVKLNIDLNAPPTGDLSFEPFHTVDYFASQGIKLSQEDPGKDKFGKQLKSFTEWLKSMKKLPQAELAASVDKSSESKVENLAAGSLLDREVLTEAMAEVWLKQGNKAKALEVYNKLSLLNPSKKSYFAAKIEEFNSHN